MIDSLTRRRMTGYVVVSVLHLGFLLTGPAAGHVVTKLLVMPLLALAVLPTAPKLLTGALLASWVGDIMLLFDGIPFLIGMAAFAAAHVCYITLFVRGRGAFGGVRFGAVVVGYAAVWGVLITLLWPDLPAGLRIPVACYSLLLVGTATTATLGGPRTALGGALFLLSDSLIAAGLAHWSRPPAIDFWIMLAYLAGQMLLATGLAKRRSSVGSSRFQALA